MTLSRRGFLLLSLLCAALACTVFAVGLPGGFILDDVSNIVENSGIRLESLAPAAVIDAAFSTQVGGTLRTLPTLTFALDYLRGGGLDPATFKATNIAIHALTTLMLAWFLRDLLRAANVAAGHARWLALGMALAWALHPLQVSAVLYVVQRMQTLATLFVVLALWAYLRARTAQASGEPGRTGWLLAGLAWAAALGCKEDAILLPAYLLALELTVLGFRASDAQLARRLRSGYLLAAGAAALVYLLLVLPYFWSWETYANRDFSSWERLLTQGRVLCLYLGQMLAPLPTHMPFFYDWLQPSRGLLAPWTTLPALLLLAALLAQAWRLRRQRPLFALGVFVFFAGHFITSNALSLELAFEHRNHFPLLGIVLAVCDLGRWAASRLRIPLLPWAVVSVLALCGLGGATIMRAKDWDSGLSLAQASVRLAPQSVRGWHFLCVEWYELGGGARADNPHLDKAIAACGKAAAMAPDSVASLANVLVFKTLRGTVASADWEAYLDRIRRAPVTGETVNSMWTMMSMVRQGIALDHDGVLAVIDSICGRARFSSPDTAAIGHFILAETGQRDRAFPFFAQAVQTADDLTFAYGLIGFLRREGEQEWADRLQAMMRAPDGM